jgi:hypothetical protein
MSSMPTSSDNASVVKGRSESPEPRRSKTIRREKVASFLRKSPRSRHLPNTFEVREPARHVRDFEEWC